MAMTYAFALAVLKCANPATAIVAHCWPFVQLNAWIASTLKRWADIIADELGQGMPSQRSSVQFPACHAMPYRAVPRQISWRDRDQSTSRCPTAH